MIRNALYIIALATILVSTTPVGALDSLIVNVDRSAVIVNPSNINDTRALLRFDLPRELDSTKYVTYAELRLNVNLPQRFNNIIRLKICPITRDWSPQNARWNGTWTHPGGDFADTISAIAHLDSTSTSILRIDVAHIIHYYINGSIQNLGLMIQQLGEHRNAFGIVPQRAPGADIAQLAIYYVDMDPDD